VKEKHGKEVSRRGVCEGWRCVSGGLLIVVILEWGGGRRSGMAATQRRVDILPAYGLKVGTVVAVVLKDVQSKVDFLLGLERGGADAMCLTYLTLEGGEDSVGVLAELGLDDEICVGRLAGGDAAVGEACQVYVKKSNWGINLFFPGKFHLSVDRVQTLIECFSRIRCASAAAEPRAAWRRLVSHNTPTVIHIDRDMVRGVDSTLLSYADGLFHSMDHPYLRDAYHEAETYWTTFFSLFSYSLIEICFSFLPSLVLMSY
jgi:hypothetical protein